MTKKTIDDLHTILVRLWLQGTFDEDQGKDVNQAKSELLTLILSLKPEKKNITVQFPVDKYLEGYDKGTDDYEDAIRKVLE